MPASKLMLQQNHIKDSVNTNTISTTTPYINGQQNGSSAKVVLVTSESMEIDHNRKTASTSNNGTDEELTSLTWLHDKNLLKGINSISCPSNVKHMNNNHLKIVTDNALIKPQSQQAMSSKSPSSGAATPTSDFVDDSGVSEDNVSSMTSDNISGSEQGNSIYRKVRTTPKSFATTPRERDSDTIDNEDIDDANNNTINKNRTISNANQVPSTNSSIIHLSPGGSTVIEYKTVSSLTQKSNFIPNTSSPLSNANPVILSTNNGVVFAANSTTNVIKTISTHQKLSTQSLTSSSTTTSTPHTHFHKKYIKAMNALNGSGTETKTTLITTQITNSNSEAQVSSPSTVVSVRTPPPNAIYTIPMKPEFSTAKYEHETVIVENEYPHSAINLVSNSNHRIYHGNDIDRHSDEYVTPISSPRLQQQPAAPQKLLNSNNNSTANSPTDISLSQPTVPLSSASPNSTQNQVKPSNNNVPYDPFIHTNNKPPLSFSSLIFLAIEDAKEKALPVKEIYAWIVKHYPYFKTAPTGWKNSVRHNLSLNKCFQKVEKAPNMGKGSLWRVEQQYKQNLIIALTRSSYHPNTSAMEKATASLKNTPISPDSPTSKSSKRPLDAELFPRLSKYMANIQNGNSVKISATNNTNDVMHLIADKEYQIINNEYNHVNGESVIVTTSHGIHTNHTAHDHEMDAIEAQRNVERIARDWGMDNIDDVNAATAMLALKHGPKIFSETFQTGTPIITTKPSEDHTYSAGGGTTKSAGNTVSTIVNFGQTVNEPIVQFNGNSSPPTAPQQVQIKYDSNTLNNHGTEIIIDNMSNGTSSDAAYESSEESQNDISREEEEARRHQEGIDAFLSFATEVSSMSSPLKRPPSSSDYVENVPLQNYNTNHNNNHHMFGNGNYYYNSSSNQQYGQQNIYSYMSSPSPPKKSRSRTLRTKLKKKTWLR
ncbi:putative uncharacterized protein DDB_G0277255 [Contarinia nasturtii]|uniref:putative uncharacterized protein DDB_G0277255 n=1 Tax=Contarinia nasturtii TaxID=265458 RepID=UPI0012D4163C|nr:putative uncharacterized protein DDB_G0277255 [Contarinia nasturtii]XP_031637382.1 putative uncharacterized protein DDB_G0277255 [Contarinia nasturtii]XP_031637383.1 putative uncharacterized protein DDB_G0277255 [Contarinia nasturtii]XP_031637384.1 putative uncharacterized protein DDB_G0277255 [Contarinia nasturtii]XP_031637385.1 putative uncharacterized protein DDB_G0277255 [Contarinia nasturtii]